MFIFQSSSLVRFERILHPCSSSPTASAPFLSFFSWNYKALRGPDICGHLDERHRPLFSFSVCQRMQKNDIITSHLSHISLTGDWGSSWHHSSVNGTGDQQPKSPLKASWTGPRQFYWWYWRPRLHSTSRSHDADIPFPVSAFTNQGPFL